MTSIVILGRVEVESSTVESEAVDSPLRTHYRPVGTPLLNDGRWHYWITPGEEYGIRHDGAGWRVTCETWGSGHVYRLVDTAGRFVDALPCTTGLVALDPGCAYGLRAEGPHGPWVLVETT